MRPYYASGSGIAVPGSSGVGAGVTGSGTGAGRGAGSAPGAVTSGAGAPGLTAGSIGFDSTGGTFSTGPGGAATGGFPSGYL
jgi:hypothetical protein